MSDSNNKTTAWVIQMDQPPSMNFIASDPVFWRAALIISIGLSAIFCIIGMVGAAPANTMYALSGVTVFLFVGYGLFRNALYQRNRYVNYFYQINPYAIYMEENRMDKSGVVSDSLYNGFFFFLGDISNIYGDEKEGRLLLTVEQYVHYSSLDHAQLEAIRMMGYKNPYGDDLLNEYRYLDFKPDYDFTLTEPDEKKKRLGNGVFNLKSTVETYRPLEVTIYCKEGTYQETKDLLSDYIHQEKYRKHPYYN